MESGSCVIGVSSECQGLDPFLCAFCIHLQRMRLEEQLAWSRQEEKAEKGRFLCFLLSILRDHGPVPTWSSAAQDSFLRLLLGCDPQDATLILSPSWMHSE